MSSTNRGGTRREGDFYPTPPWCVGVIARELDPEHAQALRWGEPCIGNGVVPATMHATLGTPTDWAWAEISSGRDYLTDGMTAVPEPDGPRASVDAILTNPPFTHFQSFIEHGLEDSPFVSMLMRITVLGGQKRRDWWQHRMPTHSFVMSQRPSFTGKGTDSVEYAWFTWDRIGLCRRAPGWYVL